MLHQRSQHIDTFSLIPVENELQDLLLRIFHHLLTREVRISLSCPGKQQTQVIVHLSGGTYSRAGILIGGFLVDGYHWTEARDLIHIWTFQVSQKVTGVSREGLYIATLTLSKDGIESQR